MNTHEVPLRERVRAQLLELISEMDLTVNTTAGSEISGEPQRHPYSPQ